MSIPFIITNQSYAASDWTGNINLALGEKWPVYPLPDNQKEVGLNVDFGKKSWPLHIAFAILGSSSSYTEDEGSITASTSELRFGANKIWETAPAKQPCIYLGCGLALTHGEVEHQWDGQSIGGYVNGGIFWTLAEHYNLGIDLGYSKATDHSSHVGFGMGGGHATLFFGYHW